MSSKNAMYESSILGGFGTGDDELAGGVGLATDGGGATLAVVAASAGREDFGLGFEAVVVSLLTRTDAGIMAVSSGVC